MPCRNHIAKTLAIAAALAFGRGAFALCGSLDGNGASKAGPVVSQHFVYRFDDTWKKVQEIPEELEPDGGEVASVYTDSGGWSLAWIFISSPDWIWTKNYCFAPSGMMANAESRFSCAWGWIAVQTASLSGGTVHKSAITFIDNKTLKRIPKPTGADEFRDDVGDFSISSKQGDLPFAKLLSKTGVGK